MGKIIFSAKAVFPKALFEPMEKKDFHKQTSAPTAEKQNASQCRGFIDVHFCVFSKGERRRDAYGARKASLP